MKRLLSVRGRRRRLGSIGVLAVVGLAAAWILSITAFAGGAGASSGAAAPTRQAPALRRAVVASGGPDAVRAYWTKYRMEHAKPLGGIAGTRSSSAATNAGNTATGKPGTAGGLVPADLPSVPGPASAPNANLQSSSVSPADGGFPGPNDTFDWWPKYRVFPISTVGKLFFTIGTGNFVCTAAATYGGNLDMVWTAGHCVGAQGGQQYYNNWLFCPSYVYGENPALGCWSWALAQQTGGWYFNGYWGSDYAYLYMQPFSDKVSGHVINYTGGLGFAWNWGRDQHWFDMGYPSGSPYDGGALVVTAAEHRYDVNNGQADGSSDNSIGSLQTPGFSGGPWILSFGNNGGTDPHSHGDWINSVNSYYFTAGANGNEYGKEIQGPYFDTNACNFWKGGSGWPGTC